MRAELVGMTATATATRPAPRTTPAPTATSTATPRIRTGNVIELDIDGVAFSALVLLAAGDAVILDACDGSTPVVVRLIDLGPVRVFDPR